MRNIYRLSTLAIVASVIALLASAPARADEHSTNTPEFKHFSACIFTHAIIDQSATSTDDGASAISIMNKCVDEIATFCRSWGLASGDCGWVAGFTVEALLRDLGR